MLKDLPEKYQDQARKKMGMAPEPIQARRSKYGAQKTEVDGIIFDSKAEARYYETLKAYEKIGQIYDLKLQPRFELQPAFTKNGKKERPICYVADFIYKDRNGVTVVVDVKGKKTDVYKLKKKLFEYKYPDLTITEVKP